MSNKASTKKQKGTQGNPYETLKNSPTTGFLDRVLGSHDSEDNFMEQFLERREKKQEAPARRESSLFSYNEYHEKEIVRNQISELTEQIKREIVSLKSAESSLARDVADLEKHVINPLPEKPGVYHIRFLELVLSMVRTVRMKIGESKTWLEAMVSKKKKRGSAFAARSKKMGTQYSLSQELQNSRSVQ